MIRRPPRSTLFPTRRSSDLPADVLRRLGRLVVGTRELGHAGALDHRVGLAGQRRRRVRALGSRPRRSEEHTSELQSLAYLVCRLLLEKKTSYHYPPIPSPRS